MLFSLKSRECSDLNVEGGLEGAFISDVMGPIVVFNNLRIAHDDDRHFSAI